MFKRNKIFIILLACMVLVSLPALGAGKPFAGTTLNVMAIAQCYADGVNKYADQIYNELGIKFNFDTSPPQDAYSKAMMEFSTQSSSFDLVLFEPAWIADYSKHLEPLEPLMKKYHVDLKLNDIMTSYRDIYSSWNKTLYAIPWDGDQFNLFYNTDAFNRKENKDAFKKAYGYELAPPQTWDQYLQMAQFFNNRDWNGDGKKKYGAVEAWQRGGYAYWWFWAKYAGYGGVYFDENMNPLINTPGAKHALDLMVKLSKCVPPGTANFGYPECETAFIKGDAPMVVQWVSTGKSAMDPKNSNIVGKVGVTVLPGSKINGKLFRRPVMPTGWSWGIPKYTKNKEAALKVIEILSRPDNALDISLDPGTAVDPWRKSSFESEKWLTQWPNSPQFGKDLVKTMHETVATGLPDLQIPGSDEYVKSLDAQISFALSGQKSVEAALADAEKEWNAITDRIGRASQKKNWNNQYNSMKKLGIKYIPWKE